MDGHPTVYHSYKVSRLCKLCDWWMSPEMVDEDGRCPCCRAKIRRKRRSLSYEKRKARGDYDQKERFIPAYE